MRHLEWRTALDNYDRTREFMAGHIVEYVPGDEHATKLTLKIVNPSSALKDAHKSNYIVDDGNTVTVFYVAGWNDAPRDGQPPYILLQPFPVNGKREDNGEPYTMDSWMLGPRRTYHLKVREIQL